MKKTGFRMLMLLLVFALAGCSASRNEGDISIDNTDPIYETESTAQNVQNQLSDYLTQLFTQAYQPFYEGLHYEITDYEETIAVDGGFSATFLWTMFFKGNGLDVPGDLDQEQQVNYPLQATGRVEAGGQPDFDTLQILVDSSVTGEPRYEVPIISIFPGGEESDDA